MCVICAYTGKRKAAPLLLEAGRRIEGLWSGFYTGIGTLDNGVIHCRKTTGCSDFWLKRFSYDELPGNTGFFHSRTGSGGAESFAHPFVSNDGSVMLVSQGSIGRFKNELDKFTAAAIDMSANGIRFSSATSNLSPAKYCILPNDTQVHISDVVNEAVAVAYARSKNPFAAIREVLSVLREESVSLFIFRDRPGFIYAGNVNQRLCAYSDSDGIILTTCALACGNVPHRIIEIPPNSVIEASADTLKIERLASCFAVDSVLPFGLAQCFIEYLKEKPESVLAHITDNALAPLFHGTELELRAAAAYTVFEFLYYDGQLRLENSFIPGVGSDYACHTRVSLK